MNVAIRAARIARKPTVEAKMAEVGARPSMRVAGSGRVVMACSIIKISSKMERNVKTWNH